MFKTPVSTIRDVAELTEASPNLIARILGEMRGPGELEKISNRLDGQDLIIQDMTSRLNNISKTSAHPEMSEFDDAISIPTGLTNFLTAIESRGERINIKVVCGMFIVFLIVLFLSLNYAVGLGPK